jgi:hypothetical protein
MHRAAQLRVIIATSVAEIRDCSTFLIVDVRPPSPRLSIGIVGSKFSKNSRICAGHESWEDF